MLTLRLLPILLLFPAIALAGNDALLEKIIQGAKESESDSLVIVENGRAIYSNYFHGKDGLYSVQSITKSICALAIGVLLDEGKISSLDLPMSTWIPAWRVDPQKSKITLRMIMNHTSGLPDIGTVPEFWQQPDIVLAATTTSLIAEPGSSYLYSNIGSSLLQPVIQQAAGKSATDFVHEKVFAPLRILDFRWNKDKAGQEISSGGIYLRTKDLVKLGKMLLQGGELWGKRVIQAKTLELLVSKSQPYFSYGLLFWLDQSPSGGSLFSAIGWGGQYIVVFPEKNLIAIRVKDPKSIKDKGRQKFKDFRSLISQWE